MRSKNWLKLQRRGGIRRRVQKVMKCLCSGEQLRADKMVPSSEILATNDYSASGSSSRAAEFEMKQDTGNIEEAESSLRESGCLNFEEARALLGRYEYQKGNIEAALHVFEGIDIAAVAPKMKLTLAKRGERRRRRPRSDVATPMSIHAVILLLEAIFLKAKSLQCLGRFKEAALSCSIILDIVESSLPEGLHVNFGSECKFQETVNKAIELLPELWKLADSPREAILSYRRALLHPWNLDAGTNAKIQKEFAIFLLYSGGEASPPELRSQMDGSFIPRNNIEEAILLLMMLLRKITLEKIEWDPSILDHLSYALSLSGGLSALANQVEELLPGTMNRKERYYILALCYYGDGDSLTALNLLKKLLNEREDPKHLPALLMASKICGENPNTAEEGISFAHRALESLQGRCEEMGIVANYLLGVSLSVHTKSNVGDPKWALRKAEALDALETAGRMMKVRDPRVVYHLSLENAEQRNLDAALCYAKCFIKLEGGGSSVKGWLLLARIFSAQKRFMDAETVINAAVDQTGKWDQGELLRTKAKLQIARGQLRQAIDTYSHLFALLQVQRKSFGSGKKSLKGSGYHDRSLELNAWHDLANLYISLSRWQDAEICLSKSRAINPHSADRYHATGLLNERQGLHKEALKAWLKALDIEPAHVPSLISMAVVLRRLGTQSNAVVRGFLTEAVKLDRMNPSAWYNLGLVYKDQGSAFSAEAAECFEAATTLEESMPIEPFS